VSRITRGKIDLKKEYVELADVVANAVETASPLFEERQHYLDIRVPRRGCSIHADKERLAQVVANLLTNAAKYTEPRGSIEISAGRDADAVVVSVRDTGIGIDPAMQASVFDVFTQARQALDRSQGGLGLGLAIVRSLVTLHGGTVSVFSEGLGRGTTFTVRLPYAEMPHAGSPAQARPALPSTAAGAGRILIVDDNRDSAEMIAAALSALGYATHVAFDAPGALRVVQELRFDVALLDIGLPVMSGYELAHRLREAPASAEIALVAVTGYGQPRDRLASGDAGFDAHLVKPVDLEQIEREAIMKALRKRLADQRYHLLQEHSGLTALAQESLIENLLSEISGHTAGKVVRMSVPDEIAGKSLKESRFRARYESHVIAIQKASGELITAPDPEHVLLREDTLIVFRDKNGDERETNGGI
jgi:CheY-like chemotaxis protein/anti-sigma regulatory factor (Ser/Thr protein kinase)